MKVSLFKNDLMKKKWFTLSNIITGVFIIFILAMLLNPGLKATVIQGMMKIGLFQPDIPKASEIKKTTSSLPPDNKEILLRNVDGTILDLSAQKNKVIFINFWATWCPPCIAEMPSINKLYQQFKDNENVLFLMVDVDNNFDKSNTFIKKKGFTLPVYAQVSDIPAKYFSGTLPTTVILDKLGNIAFHHDGVADYSNSKVANFIKRLSE
jgi:thiol-disulfide isomerase/thioredoxin